MTPVQAKLHSLFGYWLILFQKLSIPSDGDGVELKKVKNKCGRATHVVASRMWIYDRA